MPFSRFDRRIMPDPVVDLVRACQQAVPCEVGGGAALAGAFLAHRLSVDVDLFCEKPAEVRRLVAELQRLGDDVGLNLEIRRDVGTFARATAKTCDRPFDVDILFEPRLDETASPLTIEGVVVRSLPDLRAAKVTCLLSRTEPRDLVDLLFLDRAGFPPENDFALALGKDAGLDPLVLAWLLREFPVEPLPKMLVPLEPKELRAFRDQLRERFRRLGPTE